MRSVCSGWKAHSGSMFVHRSHMFMHTFTGKSIVGKGIQVPQDLSDFFRHTPESTWKFVLFSFRSFLYDEDVRNSLWSWQTLLIASIMVTKNWWGNVLRDLGHSTRPKIKGTSLILGLRICPKWIHSCISICCGLKIFHVFLFHIKIGLQNADCFLVNLLILMALKMFDTIQSISLINKLSKIVWLVSSLKIWIVLAHLHRNINPEP